MEAWTAAEAERAAARAKEATAAEEAAARREGSREKSRVAEMQASLDAAARAAAAAEAAASTATAAQAQAAAAQAHAEAQLLSLEQRVAEEVALRASAVDPLAEATGSLAQLGQLTLRLGTVEEALAQLASAAAAAAVDATAAAAAAAAAARAAKAEEQEDPWRRQTWAELREVSDKQRRAEARLLELGLLVSRCDALEARGVAVGCGRPARPMDEEASAAREVLRPPAPRRQPSRPWCAVGCLRLVVDPIGEQQPQATKCISGGAVAEQRRRPVEPREAVQVERQ